jgi:dTDP-L-rhamnose 4-epimerase
VSDIVQANLLIKDCTEADYGVFNVGTGRATSILDVANALINHMGLKIAPEVVQKFRAGDIRHCIADIEHLAALGYSPKVRFTDGIAGLVEWVSSQTAKDSFETARQELVKKGLAV